jgi:phosphatidylserine decarboxylase
MSDSTWIQRSLYQAVRVLPRHELTRLAGRLAQATIPVALRPTLYGGFSRMTGAMPGEAELGTERYATFDAFFTRKLRDGVRTFDAAVQGITSPADGALAAHGIIEQGTLIQAKGIDYPVHALLGDNEWGDRFQQGVFATVYLSPADYHRVHVPADFTIERVRHLGGELWPVNNLSVPFVRGLFAVNERVAAMGTLADGTPFAMVMVAATVVGGMEISHPAINTSSTHRAVDAEWDLTPAWQAKAGDEFGVFHLGSTVVMVVGGDPQRWVIEAPRRANNKVRVGELLLRHACHEPSANA